MNKSLGAMWRHNHNIKSILRLNLANVDEVGSTVRRLHRVQPSSFNHRLQFRHELEDKFKSAHILSLPGFNTHPIRLTC